MSKHYSEEEKEKIFNLYEKGLNCKEIGDILGKTNKAINKFLHRHNLNTNHSIYKIITEQEIEDIKKCYLNGMTGKEIQQKYSNKIKSENTVIKILKDSNITIRPPKRFSKITFEDFFETIDTEEKAYILGLLAADGYIIYPNRKNRTPIVGITLKLSDKYLLEKIKEIIGLDKKISENTNAIKNSNKKRNEAILTITSEKMVKDLEKFGITRQKTFNIKFPNISNELLPHFIRGIFDGDGCISSQTISFTGNKYIMNSLQELLINNLNINKTKIYKVSYETSKNEIHEKYIFSFSSKKNVKSFYEYIYKNSTIYLNRKKEKFEKLPFITKL